MANYHDARIPLENLSDVFGHTKSYPGKLLVPEVQDCEFNVLSDGSADIVFGIREDYDGSARMLSPTGPTMAVRLEATKEQVLDCVAHSGVMDVMLSEHSKRASVEHECVTAEISEDYIRQVLWEESKALVWSYLCLFKLSSTNLVEYKK